MMEDGLEKMFTEWGQGHRVLVNIVFNKPEKREKVFRLVHRLFDDLSALTKDDSGELECTEPADPDSQTQQEARDDSDDDATQCDAEVTDTLSNVGKYLRGGQSFSNVVKQGHLALRHSLTMRWTRMIAIATAKCLSPSLDNRITRYSMFLISASTPSRSTQSAPSVYAPSPVIAPFPMFPVSRCHSHCESLATMHV